MRVRWGLAGLLGFEAVLVAFTAARGVSPYTLMGIVAGAALAWAIVAHARSGRVPRAALAVLALVMLARALSQTLGGPVPPGLWTTYLLPLGFALLLVPRVRPAVGIGLVAIARSWFVVWYFQLGVPMLVAANVLGAIGAWLWWSEDALSARPDAADEGAPQA